MLRPLAGVVQTDDEVLGVGVASDRFRGRQPACFRVVQPGERSQEVADVRLVLDDRVGVTELRHGSYAARSVKREVAREAVPLVGVQCGEVADEDTHHLVIDRVPRLTSVLVVVVRTRDLARSTDDPLVEGGRGLQWGPVPRLVDADRLLQWEVPIVLAVLDTIPDLHHLVVPVMAPDVVDADDVVFLDEEVLGVVHLDHLDAFEFNELPLVGVLVEVLLATFAVNDAHATVLQRFWLQVEPAILVVPANDFHVEFGAEHDALVATEAETDRRLLDHLEVCHLSADLTGVSVRTDPRGVDQRIAAFALALADVLQAGVPKAPAVQLHLLRRRPALTD